MENLINNLMTWLNSIGINDSINLSTQDYFEYDWDKNCICVGETWDFLTKTFTPWLKQFLHEYGMRDDVYCSYPTLAFLHELGHHVTEHLFTEFEIGFMQNFMKPDCNSYEDCEEYWLVPDELSATLWEIWFINNFSNHVRTLERIMQKYWW